MAKVLFFQTEEEGEFKNIRPKDGSVTIDGHTFFLNGSYDFVYCPVCKKEYTIDKLVCENPACNRQELVIETIQSKPLCYVKKGMLGKEPLYLLKWDSLVPATIKSAIDDRKIFMQNVKGMITGKTQPMLRNYISNVVFTRDAKNTPESIYKTEKLKILGGMLKIKRAVGGGIWMSIIFMVIGMVVMFLLFKMHVIK